MTSNNGELKYTNKLKDYNRNSFDCGIAALNTYLKRQAGQDVKRNLAVCYLGLIDSEIIGFYTLSRHLIKRKEMPDIFQKQIPLTYDCPATLIGRLGVDKRYIQKGYGTKILMHALYKIYLGSQNSATKGAVVVAKEASKEFYIKNGFIPLIAEERKYFLPIEVIRDSIEGNMK